VGRVKGNERPPINLEANENVMASKQLVTRRDWVSQIKNKSEGNPESGTRKVKADLEMQRDIKIPQS